MAARTSNRSRERQVPYKLLNDLSSVDLLYEEKSKTKKTLNKSLGIIKAERLIACRKDSEGRRYLVKWEKYSTFQNTWEPEEHISPLLLRYFERPCPPKDLVDLCVDRLRIAVMEALRHKGPEQRVVVEFCHDVYKYLFMKKGKNSNVEKSWNMFEEGDFDKCYFPANWNQIIDGHGDGVKLKFPVKMRSFLSISPRTYQKVGEEMKLVPRAYIEKLSLRFIKIPTSCS